MSADFTAGYVSGAIGIIVGNPLDILKTRLQAASPTLPQPPNPAGSPGQFTHWTSLARGATAPILGYGALNGLLFLTYNRSLALLSTGDVSSTPVHPSLWQIWTAGALGGFASFVVSAPTEVIKCRAQVSQPPKSSLEVARELWRARGVRGMYMGGGITSVRDAVGYGFYFWSYQLCKQTLTVDEESSSQQTLKILLCGGIAGIVTWTSIFPLDALKTRVQTWDLIPQSHPEARPLLQDTRSTRPSTLRIAKAAYHAEGMQVFFRGLGVCNARAFVVNAVQFFVYEWMMRVLAS